LPRPASPCLTLPCRALCRLAKMSHLTRRSPSQARPCLARPCQARPSHTVPGLTEPRPARIRKAHCASHSIGCFTPSSGDALPSQAPPRPARSHQTLPGRTSPDLARARSASHSARAFFSPDRMEKPRLAGPYRVMPRLALPQLATPCLATFGKEVQATATASASSSGTSPRNSVTNRPYFGRKSIIPMSPAIFIQCITRSLSTTSES